MWPTFFALTMTLLSTFLAPSPPQNQTSLCDVFREHPKWYDYTLASQQKWQTPIAIQMAFIQQESSFRSHVKPARTKLYGVIPWSRPSTAHGYAQALDPVWGEYIADRGQSIFARRTHIKHAADFVGWYNYRTHQALGIPFNDAERLYLAYHQGPTGYRRGSYLNQPDVQNYARRVRQRAARYHSQLSQCEYEFQCRRFYQIGPFCPH